MCSPQPYAEVLIPKTVAFSGNWSFLKTGRKPSPIPPFPVARKAMCAQAEMLAIFEPSSKADLTRIFKLDF